MGLLRHAFDPIVERLADPALREHDAALQRIVDESPRLFAAYLGRLDRLQRSLAELLQARAARRHGCEPDSVVLRAVVGGAFACLHAAMVHAVAQPDDFGHCLDRTMKALRPVDAAA